MPDSSVWPVSSSIRWWKVGSSRSSPARTVARRSRSWALRGSTATETTVPGKRIGSYSMGWSDSAVRRYVRDAGSLLQELNVLTRCDCTTRNEKKAARLSRRMDELERRIDELAEAEELAALRPEIDGNQVIEHLGIEPGRVVGEAMNFLMEIRLEEGLLGDDAIRERLDVWWTEQQD